MKRMGDSAFCALWPELFQKTDGRRLQECQQSPKPSVLIHETAFHESVMKRTVG